MKFDYIELNLNEVNLIELNCVVLISIELSWTDSKQSQFNLFECELKWTKYN